jgi:hypothetical protein
MNCLRAVLVVAVVGSLLALPACHREGPAEKAGKDLDKAVEYTGDAMKKAGESVSDKIDEAGEEVKDAAGR